MKIKINLIRPYVFVPLSADLIHNGHINILKKSKKLGSVIVGLMTDNGILDYKKKKPVLTYSIRKSVVQSIKYVDLVIPLDGLKYCEFANFYKFEYFIHGDDWKRGVQSRERGSLIKLMKNWGGKVIEIPYTKGISSTIIKKKLISEN